MARRVVATLHRLKGSARPVAFVEDVAVPPAALPDFLVRLQNTLKRHQVTASLYGHVGHGQLHIRPFLDLTQTDDVRKMEDLAADLYREVFEVGGSISGEHGDGLSRTPFIRQQYGELYDVFREVKQLFDPLGILNPGKIVGDESQSMTRDLRPSRLGEATKIFAAVNGAAGKGLNGSPTTGSISEARAATDVGPVAETAFANPVTGPLFEVQLNWTMAELAETSRSCNGCGSCRANASAWRMCPIFHVGPAEEASPRAKANLFRGVLAGQLSPAMLADDEFKRVADLCVNCHQCRLECPAGVDIPKLMIEAKAAYVSTNGLRRATGSWLGSIYSAPGAADSAPWPIGPFAIDRLAGCWRNAWASRKGEVAAFRLDAFPAPGRQTPVDASHAP